MMGAYSVFVLGKAAWSLTVGTAPDPATMGAIGFIALVANGIVALLLYAYRDGDANIRSVWLCSRNDAIGNVAVMLAALGVFGTDTNWPDLGVAVVMGILGLTAARTVIAQSRRELQEGTETSGAPSPSQAPMAPSSADVARAMDLKRR